MRKEKIAAEYLINKFHTNCPFQIAREMGVSIQFARFRNTFGYFSTYKRIKTIHINQELTELEQKFTCAHELGHAIMHPNVSTPFLKRHTLFSVDKIEREANTFAVELLLPDSLLQENNEYSVFSIGRSLGIPCKLILLKK